MNQLNSEIEKHPLKMFLASLVVVGFLTKIISEFIHEIGHGIFVLLFRGEILEIYISPFWPLQHSWIKWSFPRQIGREELAVIYAGGILFCLIISFLIQVLLSLRETFWFYKLSLAWLSFWTLLNGTGYLILGGIKPFGDIEQLINIGYLTQPSSFVLGLSLFIIGCYTLSKIFFGVFLKFFSAKTSRILIVIFWMQVPLYSLLYLLTIL
ncbi:MAG TPA: hypothetical protein ENF63_02305 [Candidatus Bathyarchaeota archaeon]|nr:hypothetical protein [Candidatus Bathyarchaeota archaeon]